MAHGKLLCRPRAAITVGLIGSAALMSATLAQTPKIERSDSAPPPAILLHPVTDTTHRGGPGDFADLAQKVQAAVIGVTSKAMTRKTLPGQSFEFGTPQQEGRKDDAPPPHPADSQPDSKAPELVAVGSGFFISADGYAVTTSRLVDDSDAAEVRTSDDKTYLARVVGRDPLSDLALIKVDGRTDFSFVRIADRPPRVGEWILAAGNSFGLGLTLMAGIVSAREREIGTGPMDGLLQIDAPINSGDSGGPSFNTSGEVIGVNSMIFSPTGGSTGVAFAVPADTVNAVIAQLKDKGSVTRGSMGAEVQSVTPDIADGLGENDLRGAIVAGVQENSPAAKAGLRRGDVITSAGGETIKNAHELTKKIHATAPGASIQLAMVRQGQQNSLSVTMGLLPQDERPSLGPAPR
jgi:serine protease Do